MLRVTLDAVEVVRRPATASLRVTACAAEVLRRPSTRNARASQIAVEILRTNAAPISANAQQPLVIIVAG